VLPVVVPLPIRLDLVHGSAGHSANRQQQILTPSRTDELFDWPMDRLLASQELLKSHGPLR